MPEPALQVSSTTVADSSPMHLSAEKKKNQPLEYVAENKG
jgi:hypothetical protein